MGAPTGSWDVLRTTCPRDTACPSGRCPVNRMAAAPDTEFFLMISQTSLLGIHVCAAACSGVSCGSSLVGPTARGSISPTDVRSPRDISRIADWPAANVTSMLHSVTLWSLSRQRKVGGVKSGGKFDPDAG